jgi:hypothetical protein
MSYVLKQNGEQIATSGAWNPRMFSQRTGTSFPAQVSQDFIWQTDEFDLRWVDDPPAPPPSQEQIKAQIKSQLTATVDDYLNSEAQASGYDSIISACSYAGAPNPFQAESQAFITWRGNVWATCHTIMADVEVGTRAIPTSEELVSELPEFAP